MGIRLQSEARSHARNDGLNRVATELYLFLKRKGEISIKPKTKERIRYGHRNQYQGSGVDYARGRYQHPSRPLYSTGTIRSVVCVNVSLKYQAFQIIRWERKNRREKKCFWIFDEGLNLSFLLVGLTRFTNPAPTYLKREIKAYVVLGRKMFVCWSILAKAILY